MDGFPMNIEGMAGQNRSHAFLNILGLKPIRNRIRLMVAVLPLINGARWLNGSLDIMFKAALRLLISHSNEVL